MVLNNDIIKFLNELSCLLAKNKAEIVLDGSFFETGVKIAITFCGWHELEFEEHITIKDIKEKIYKELT